MPTKKKLSEKVDKRHRGRVRIGDGPDGKPLYKYVAGRTKAELEAARAEVEAYYISGAIQQKNIMFEQYVHEWFETYKRPNLKPTTVSGYESTLKNHIIPYFAGRQMKAITPADVQKFVNRYKGMRKGTVNEVMVCTKQIFKRAYVDGIVDRDPAYGIERPKTVRKVREAILPENFPAIVKTAHEHPEGLLLALLFYGGLRKGEALGLEWGDINFQDSYICVRRGQVYVKGKITLYEAEQDALKTEAAHRNVPMPPPLAKLLSEKRGSDGDAVIAAPNTGGHMPQSTYARMWRRLMEAAGLEGQGITAHNFRHTYATILHAAQVDDKTAQYVLGHEDYATTAQIYTHIQEKQISYARDKIDHYFADL